MRGREISVIKGENSGSISWSTMRAMPRAARWKRIQSATPRPSSTSKFALEGMMEGLRSEVRPFHITVSLVEPTFFKAHFAVKAPSRPVADYAPLRESILQYVSRAVEKEPDPEQVARAILRVATTSRPRLRYRVGPRANLLVGLRQLLPATLFEGMYRRIFHLDATVIPTPGS
jgi:NAD(P)-dependent dehydrogenase (short-subunit alcohol dehydrogenase family)